jgi:hypothetical protein
MSRVEVIRSIAAPADAVWRLIGDPANMAWHPLVESSAMDEGGRIRTCVQTSGLRVVERITAHDPAARSYSYGLIDAPMPVSGFSSTLRVRPDGSGCAVHWEATFEVDAGVPAAELENIVRGIIETGLAAVAATFTK